MQYRITILYGLEDMHLICFETIFQVHIDKRKSCIKCSIGLPFYYLTQNLCTLKIGLTYEQYFKFFLSAVESQKLRSARWKNWTFPYSCQSEKWIDAPEYYPLTA